MIKSTKKKSLFDLTRKIALITGSSRGIGFILALGLAQAGATVVINGRDEKQLEQALKSLNEFGLHAQGYIFDVTDAAQIRVQVQNIEQEVGPISIFINNAGIQRRAPIIEMEETVWREVLDTNLTGAFLTTKQVVKGMIERREGKIINICSLQSEVGRATISPYTASKGGLKMLTRAMAVEWAKYNIQVNGIGPGYFATELNVNLIKDKKFDSWIRSRAPAGRWGEPEELIGTAVFLSSQASIYITGQIIYVDGGVLASL